MKTRSQQRASESEEAKDVTMKIEDVREKSKRKAAAADPVEEPMGDQPETELEPEMEAEMEVEMEAEPEPPLDVFTSNFTEDLRIEPVDGQPEQRLERHLEVFAQREQFIKAQCDQKVKGENKKADQLMNRLLRKIDALPDELLDSPADDEMLSQIRLPALHNLPSLPPTKKTVPLQRVVRIFNKDSNAEQILADWDAKCEQLNQIVNENKDLGDQS